MDFADVKFVDRIIGDQSSVLVLVQDRQFHFSWSYQVESLVLRYFFAEEIDFIWQFAFAVQMGWLRYFLAVLVSRLMHHFAIFCFILMRPLVSVKKLTGRPLVVIEDVHLLNYLPS